MRPEADDRSREKTAGSRPTADRRRDQRLRASEKTGDLTLAVAPEKPAKRGLFSFLEKNSEKSNNWAGRGRYVGIGCFCSVETNANRTKH